MKAALVFFVAVLGLPALVAADVVVPIDSVQHFVNIRAEARADSDVIGRLYQGDNMLLVHTVDGWHEIEIEAGLNGFTSTNWTKVVADASAEPAVDVADNTEPDATRAVEESPPAEATVDVAQKDVVLEGPAEEASLEEPTPVVPAAAEEAKASAPTLEPVSDLAGNGSQAVVPGPPGPQGPPGEAGPAGPPGPPGTGTLKGSVNFLTKFTDSSVGGSSQIYDDGTNIGIGTTEPKRRLEVNGSIQIHERNASVAGLIITQSSGETGYIMHNLGSTLTIGAGSVDRITIDGAGNVGIGQERPTQPLEMASGAHVTTGGVWTNNSSRADKENIAELTSKEAMDALAALQPVRFNYRADVEDEYIGFIAEDVPELVASKSRTGLSPMDIVAVLTKVVQAQQERIDELEARLIK